MDRSGLNPAVGAVISVYGEGFGGQNDGDSNAETETNPRDGIASLSVRPVGNSGSSPPLPSR